jgi:hypothetical protein
MGNLAGCLESPMLSPLFDDLGYCKAFAQYCASYWQATVRLFKPGKLPKTPEHSHFLKSDIGLAPMLYPFAVSNELWPPRHLQESKRTRPAVR